MIFTLNDFNVIMKYETKDIGGYYIMLFYNFKSLDDFIKNELMINIQSETNKLNKIENLYKSKKSDFLTLITNIVSISADTITEKKSHDLYNIADSLKKCFEQLDSICKLIDTLKHSLIHITSLHDRNMDNNYNEIKAELIEYNKKNDELFNKIFDYENNSVDALISSFEHFPNINKKIKNIKKKFINYSYNVNPLLKNIEITQEDNNLLLISEKEQKAYLPYKYSEIEKIFKNQKNKYNTMQDVVNDLYVLPLDVFKNPSIARFREAFQLIRNKENGSITKALDLALELMFKYELNPIIIAACRNLDELDIYLDCLDENELYEFHCFEIKFEISPKIIKSRKKRKI